MTCDMFNFMFCIYIYMCLMTCDVGSCVLYNCVGWCLMIVDVAHDCYIYIYIIDKFGFIGRTLS